MTQQTATTWTVAVVPDNGVLAQDIEHIRKSKAIAELVECDYNAMLDWYYSASGVKVSERYIGHFSYYAGAKRDDLTTADMRHGFDLAHEAELMTWNFDIDSYENEPGYRTSWHTY